jgi:hypothetical protein
MKYSKKALEDLYGSVAGRSVPSRKHLDVLGEAQVSVKFDDGRVVSQDMDDTRARKLFMLSDIEEGEGISAWIAAGGWDSTDAQQLLSSRLNEIYKDSLQLTNEQVRADFYKQIQSLTERKGSFNILRECLNRGTVKDLYSYINAKLKTDYPLLVNIEALKQIGNIAFAEGAVGVGPGEALISLFTEGVNPNTGDIALPDGTEVELKAGAGRPGKSRVAKLVRDFEKYTRSEFTMAEIDPSELKKGERALNVLVNYDYENAPVRVKTDGAAFKTIMNILNSKESVEYKISKIGKSLIAGYWDLPVDENNVPAAKIIRSLKDLIDRNNAGNTIKTKEFFRTADREKLIDGLSRLSSRPDIAKEIISGAVDSNTGKDRGQLALIIAMTFQITEYYDELKQKFDYYTLFNKITGKIVSWGPFSDNYTNNANRVLKNLLDNFDSVKISGDSGGRTGYNLSI